MKHKEQEMGTGNRLNPRGGFDPQGKHHDTTLQILNCSSNLKRQAIEKTFRISLFYEGIRRNLSRRTKTRQVKR
jgi:hypothetical protein